MKLLLINPNISPGITHRLAAAAEAAAGPATRITPLTAKVGVEYISDRAEAQLAGAAVLDMLAEHAAWHDAAIIAAFGDPGLWAARELFDIPVVGMAEAAMHTAAMVGERFSIVTFAPALGNWYRDCVRDTGLGSRLAAIRSLNTGFSTIDLVAEEKENALAELCMRTAQEDGADVVILAGAPLAGLASRIGDRVTVPLIEQVAAAVAQAETLARLGAAARPGPRPAKTSSGLSAALMQRLGAVHA